MKQITRRGKWVYAGLWAVAAALGVVGAFPAAAGQEIYVTTTADTGIGSLRTAILSANANPGTTIRFDIPVAQALNGIFRIRPVEMLPELTGDGTVIDGTSQTLVTGDTNPNGPEVMINGELSCGNAIGLIVFAESCRIKGLILNGWDGCGIAIHGANAVNNQVQGCFIGTNAAGTAAVPNNIHGVQITGSATNNLVGGTTAGAGNLISGNGASGVLISGMNSEFPQGNQVIGNYIGVNRTGSALVPNGGPNGDPGAPGVSIGEGKNNVIAGNVISGSFAGVGLGWVTATGNVVRGNLIGTNAAGTAALGNTHGVWIRNGANHNTIGGDDASDRNVISGSAFHGVWLWGAGTSSNFIRANYIGTDALGSTPLPNARYGIYVSNSANSNVIGGEHPGMRNVISGNGGSGVCVSGVSETGAGTTGTQVKGNYIGTDATGEIPVSNANHGIHLVNKAQWNLIGGPAEGARNVISSNGKHGIYLEGQAALHNTIQGCYVGTDKNGAQALPNGEHGICVLQARQTLIGGTTASRSNLISGNQKHGIYFWTEESMDNWAYGNRIGTNASGSGALGNGRSGIFLDGARQNVIGATSSGAGNRIAFNGWDGVTVSYAASGNAVRGNSISDNTGRGINLLSQFEDPQWGSVAQNDESDKDTDSGGNGLQNYPVLSSATVGLGVTVLSGTLKSTPNTTFRIDFYRSPTRDPSTYGEGRYYAGTKTVTTNAYGTASFSYSVTGTYTSTWFTATATRAGTGDTSEFSLAKWSTTVVAP